MAGRTRLLFSLDAKAEPGSGGLGFYRACGACGRVYASALRYCPADGAHLLGAVTESTRHEPTRVVDGYELGPRLGAGALGEVHRGLHPTTGEVRLLRVLEPAVAASVVLMTRLERARTRALARLERAGRIEFAGALEFTAAALHSRAPDAGLIPLDDLILAAPLRPSRAARIIARLARHLAPLHASGLAHGGLEGSSIWVDPDCILEPVVLDLGLTAGLGARPLVDEGPYLFSADGLAPEQARGAEATPASDVYALGALLYRLLTGRPPFEGRTARGALDQHLYRRVREPGSVVALGDATELDGIVRAALDKAQGRRQAGAFGLAAELESRFLSRRRQSTPLGRSLGNQPST